MQSANDGVRILNRDSVENIELIMDTQRLQRALDDMSNRIDKKFLRSIQKKQFMCSAGCMDDQTSSQHVVQRCAQSCSQPIQRAEAAMTNEMNSFQKRFERCVMDCNDSAHDLLAGSQHSPTIQSEIQTFADGCLSKCVDIHMELLENIESRIEKSLKSIMD